MHVVRLAGIVLGLLLCGSRRRFLKENRRLMTRICISYGRKTAAVIKGGFWCRFGLRNMGVTHAGDDFANSGHHHLLLDVNEPLDPNDAIPQDKNHLHFGAGPD